MIDFTVLPVALCSCFVIIEAAAAGLLYSIGHRTGGHVCLGVALLAQIYSLYLWR